MATPWLGYIPVPGLAQISIWNAPQDPLTRFHARQANVLVVGLYVWLILVGFLMRMSDAPGYLATMGLLAGLPMVAAFVGIVWGIQAAARGRYVRIRPLWDLMSR